MERRMHYGNLFKGLLPILLAVLVAGGLIVGAQPAAALDSGPTISPSVCMQTVFSGHDAQPVPNSDKLNCTANDIRLSQALSVSPNTCIEGETFTLTATFETIVTANARYDAGFFFNIKGGANARLGDEECSLSVLTPGVSPSLDLDVDTCGDLNAGTYQITFTIPSVLCHDSNGDGFLNLPNCTSWHSNQGTVCEAATADDPYGTLADNADPDTKSKCVCDDTFQVPVIVETATLTVVKSASPTNVPESGGTVTYTVQITNDAQFVSLTIDSIIDDLYGDLGSAGNSNVTENTCPGLIGDVLGPGGNTSCTFKAFVTGDSGDTITDTVEVCGTDSAQHDVCGHDDADVNITDVFTQPTLTKTAQSAANCQVEVTYQVVVNNNSALDSLAVDSLTDDIFGDITTVHGGVISTTCATGGTIAPQGNYTCGFVGRIVSSTCSGTLTDTVTGGVTDDDGVISSPSDSANVVLTAPTFP